MDKSTKPDICEHVRTFEWEDGEENVTIVIPEMIDPAYGMYVWPCAPVLAQYVWHHRAWIKGKHVLELGAGTSLPGVMAARCGGRVTLSDDCRQPRSLQNCRRSCQANQLEGVGVIGITWGRVSPDMLLLDSVDVVLASDCFYDAKDFEDVVVTLRYFLDKNPAAKCLVAYQERSSDRSLAPLLKKWNLQCTHVLLDQFGAGSSVFARSDLHGNHTIQVMVISNG